MISLTYDTHSNRWIQKNLKSSSSTEVQRQAKYVLVTMEMGMEMELEVAEKMMVRLVVERMELPGW